MSEGLRREYQILEEIGRGRFGTVHRCFSPVTGDFYACKTVDKRRIIDPTDRRSLENEPKIMLHLPHHPNILRLHRFFEDDHHLHLLTDLCDSSDLYDRLASAPHGRLPEPDAASVFRPLVDALAHCHRHGVAHRDVKTDNVLFDSRDRPILADLGSAEWFEGGGGGGGGGKMSGIVGTPYYVAPEIVMGRDYDEKVDVWSAGVVLYVMLAGVPPFYGETAAETFEAVARGNLRFPARIFRLVSPAAKDLLRKMICRDPSKRLSAEQVLRHPWIESGGQTFSLTDVT